MFGMMRTPADSYAKVGVEVAVETADPHQLILILFDGALAAIALARIQMENGQIPEKGASISKAINLITNGLKASLNMESGGELSARLAVLYDYMAQRLIAANLKNSVAALDEVRDLLQGLREAWAEVPKNLQQAA
ncbi:MAG: flagellar export chaperone FliS [Dechloromonas sp.]|jgi:flagellar protein FliS|nr:flagellar export chaperone FliS [Dechloromonas sp.]